MTLSTVQKKTNHRGAEDAEKTGKGTGPGVNAEPQVLHGHNVPGSEISDLKDVPHGAVAEVAYDSESLKR
jgi:hypothetical protein